MIRPFRGLLISCRFMRFDTFPPQVTIMAATNSEHGFFTFYSLQSSFIPLLFLCYTYSSIPKRGLCYCLLFLSRSSSIFMFSLLFIPSMITGVSENSRLPYKFVGISHEFIRQKGIPAHPGMIIVTAISNGRRLALSTCTMHNVLFVQHDSPVSNKDPFLQL